MAYHSFVITCDNQSSLGWRILAAIPPLLGMCVVIALILYARIRAGEE